jgi:hypothetical protein
VSEERRPRPQTMAACRLEPWEGSEAPAPEGDVARDAPLRRPVNRRSARFPAWCDSLSGRMQIGCYGALFFVSWTGTVLRTLKGDGIRVTVW